MRRIQANLEYFHRQNLSISGKVRIRLSYLWLYFAFSVLALSIACASTGPLEETREDTFTVGPSPRLVVDSDYGRIDVASGPQGVVVVQSTNRMPSKLDYEVIREGDTITVLAKQQPGIRNLSLVNIPSADLTITVPSSTFVNLYTGNGDVEIEGLKASGSLKILNGRISMLDVEGHFDGTTSNGDINISTIEGNAELMTSSGGVRIENGKGEFNLETSNGEIFFQGELIQGGNNGFTTSNGGVTVQLQGEPSVRLMATTNNGIVSNSIPIRSNSPNNRSLSGIIGRGEAELIIQASNGSVTLE